VQSWPLAFWPDGTVKWSGLATPCGPDSSDQMTLRVIRGGGETPVAELTISHTDVAVEVDTGLLQCTIPTSGPHLFETLDMGGQVVAHRARLVCVKQDGPDGEAEHSPSRQRYTSDIRSVVVEQSGPVRAVVKLEGMHQTESGDLAWLPFVVRLYLYSGTAQVRLVHTIVYDGDQERDFIRALGVAFEVPLREQVHNRHVRFAGEGSGLWAEPVQPLFGSKLLGMPDGELPGDANWARSPGEVYSRQLAGERLPDREAFDERGQRLMGNYAVWDDFRLVQTSADSFAIHKRTNVESCWVSAGTGGRATGLAFVGDTRGGVAVGLKDFWQSHPASLQVMGAASDAAEVRAWLWSPDARAMDLRHYDTREHTLEASYEDVQPGFSTPHGIARTSELVLWATSDLPDRDLLVQQAQLSARPPHLVCSPEYLHSVQSLGVWSLPDRSSPAKEWVEDKLDLVTTFYMNEVEQRRWYGFWDYGDIMHDYDHGRHVWRYDIGGFAWDNTECAPDMWLWLSYLRTGRADLFRFAEAMTRHTGEVDVHHLGRFAGLGSRHNVRHWGCGAKEVRISQAAFKRYYYYLTTDERAGDLMREVVDVDRTLLEIDPMRRARPADQTPNDLPARLRLGPDWLSLVGNWMTEWERTGDTRWRDKILVGVEAAAREPFGFFTGSIFEYDPATGELRALSRQNPGAYLLLTIMGGAEVGFELSQVLEDDTWQRLWTQLCRLYCAEPEEVGAAFGKEVALGGKSSYFARLPAYAGAVTDDPELSRQAWKQLLGTDGGWEKTASVFTQHRVEPPLVLSPIDEAEAAQTILACMWCLNAIQVLDMAGDWAPDCHPLWDGSEGQHCAGQRVNGA